MKDMKSEHVTTVDQLKQTSKSKAKEIDDLKTNIDQHLTVISNLGTQLSKEKETGASRAGDVEKLNLNCQKLKSLIDDQMVIAEKQRAKVIAAQQEEQNLQKDVQTLQKKIAEMEKAEKLQNF